MFDEGGPSRRPNDAQAAAISHAGGPLLIVAGAGTGKTYTLAGRVADLIRRGVPPDRILLLTFTRRAAAEMLARADRYVSPGAAAGVWGGTFHSVALRLLRVYGGALGLGPNFTVVDAADGADIMNLVRTDLTLDQSGRRFPGKDTLAGIFSRVVNSRTKLGRVLEDFYPWCASDKDDIGRVFDGYMRRKRDQDVLDFDDLLLLWNALVNAPAVGNTVAGLFDHILVDEYQDTNVVQRDILVGMRKGRKDITVVGDDAQAIYGFRAATVDNILDFDRHFAGARTVLLEDNYRSTQAILDVSNAVMRAAPRRHAKELRATGDDGPRPVLATCWDEAHQSGAVCLHVLEAREAGIALQRQAVLFRATHHSAALELELNRRNIPFVKFGGLRFVETSHVKDLLALMRVLENPHDELAWFRSLQLVDGVGPAGATRVMSELGVRSEAPDGARPSPLTKFIDSEPSAVRGADGGLEALRAGLGDCARAPAGPAARIDRLVVFLEPVLDRIYHDARARMADLEQLARIATGYSSCSRFIEDLCLDPPHSTGNLAGVPSLDDDYLVLSTIHSAKGCEWDAVHVIHAADGMIPSDMATGSEDGIAEERRLFYVALTRARRLLYVYWPLRYYHRRMGLDDRHNFAQMSRFLSDDVMALLQHETHGPMADDSPPAAARDARAVVDAALGDLFS